LIQYRGEISHSVHSNSAVRKSGFTCGRDASLSLA
jgi:hypothetical protein